MKFHEALNSLKNNEALWSNESYRSKSNISSVNWILSYSRVHDEFSYMFFIQVGPFFGPFGLFLTKRNFENALKPF